MEFQAWIVDDVSSRFDAMAEARQRPRPGEDVKHLTSLSHEWFLIFP